MMRYVAVTNPEREAETRRIIRERMEALRVDRLAAQLETIPGAYRAGWDGWQDDVAPGAREQRLAAQRWAEEFRPGQQGLWLHGPTGVGKTALAFGILRGVIARGITVAWRNVPMLMQEIRSAWDRAAGSDEDREVETMETLTSADLVMLDDLGAEAHRDWVMERLYLAVEAIHARGERTLLVTSNVAPDDLARAWGDMGARMGSRLGALCRVVPIGGVDRRRLLRREEG